MEDLQNQNQQNNFNQIPQQNPKKQIPSWLGFVIIIVFSLAVFGGVFAYQYFTKSQQNSQFFGSSQKTDQIQTQTAGTIIEKDLLGYWKIGDAEPIAFCDYNTISGFGEYRSYLNERPAEWGTWKLEDGKLTIQYDIPGEKPILINSVARNGNALVLIGAPEFNGTYAYMSDCNGRKAYKNSEYDFEINYPLDATITNADKSVSFNFGDRQINIKVITKINAGFRCHSDITWSADSSSITLDNVVFTGVASGLKDQPFYSVQYCAIHNGSAYEITSRLLHTQGDVNRFPEDDGILNNIISTFKFTK